MSVEMKNEEVIFGLDQNENELVTIKHGDVPVKALPRKWLYLARTWKATLEQDPEETEIRVDPSIIHLETLNSILEFLEMEKGEIKHERNDEKLSLSELEYMDPKDRKQCLEEDKYNYGFITERPSEEELEDALEDAKERGEEVKELKDMERVARIEDYVKCPDHLAFLKKLRFEYEDEVVKDNFHLVFKASNYFDIPTLIHLCGRLLGVKICGVPEWKILEVTKARRITPEDEELHKEWLAEEEERLRELEELEKKIEEQRQKNMKNANKE